jgi:hypothetical protein
VETRFVVFHTSVDDALCVHSGGSVPRRARTQGRCARFTPLDGTLPRGDSNPHGIATARPSRRRVSGGQPIVVASVGSVRLLAGPAESSSGRTGIAGRPGGRHRRLTLPLGPGRCSVVSMAKSRDPTWRTAEFARHAGVTVRALRHYDRLGLLNHFKARPETLDAAEEISKSLSDGQPASIKRTLEPFSEPGPRLASEGHRRHSIVSSVETLRNQRQHALDVDAVTRRHSAVRPLAGAAL